MIAAVVVYLYSLEMPRPEQNGSPDGAAQRTAAAGLRLPPLPVL
jgi:hypothetical protein